MNFKDIQIITESNAARRAITKPRSDEFIMNQKVRPMKRIILSNDATKKLFEDWKKHGNWYDSTGKIMLDPTPEGIGGNGVYGVWQSVKGKETYASVRRINGEIWAFTETWLTEEGAKKLQNNKLPLNNDFYNGIVKSTDSWHSSERRKGLKYATKHKEEIAKDAKDLRKYGNQTDNDSYEKWNNLMRKYNSTGVKISGNNFRGESLKNSTRESQVENNFRNLRYKLDPYLSKGRPGTEEAWNLTHKIFEIEDEALKKKGNKEVANKIEKIKIDVDNFLKKHPL